MVRLSGDLRGKLSDCILSEPSLEYLLSSETHLDGVSEKKVSRWKSEFLPVCWWWKASSIPRTGRSEALVPKADLRIQMQKPCLLRLPIKDVLDLQPRRYLQLLMLAASDTAKCVWNVRHISHCYSNPWAHLPMGTYLGRMEFFPVDSLFPRDQIRIQAYPIFITPPRTSLACLTLKLFTDLSESFFFQI